MHSVDIKPRKCIIKMDPDCAVCQAPASMACNCEAKSLETAIDDAENKMMNSVYDDVR